MEECLHAMNSQQIRAEEANKTNARAKHQNIMIYNHIKVFEAQLAPAEGK
jgi:hypothetical protein